MKFQAIGQGQVKSITINGKAVKWKNIDPSVGKPIIEIAAPSSAKYIISITWEGAKPMIPPSEKTYPTGSLIELDIPGVNVLKVYDPQNVLTNISTKQSSFSAKVNASRGNYTVFIQVNQGHLLWWMPVCFKVEKPVTLVTGNDYEANRNSFWLQNNGLDNVTASVTVNSFHTSQDIPAGKISGEVIVPEKDLLTGTNNVTIKLANGATTIGQLFNWTAKTKGELETVNMTDEFNDNVTQIFRNKYLSPRPQVTTLQLPWQGTGDWPHPLETHDIDDSGFRKLAGEKNTITLPQGIPFSTPGKVEVNNILFTSQWDNYPKEKSVQLSGKASHAWFLMAGSTNPMQSQLDNGALIVSYTDGTMDTLLLRNPETWWPIEEDYYTDGFAFILKRPRPIRIHLKTGAIIREKNQETNTTVRKLKEALQQCWTCRLILLKY
jgi:hypothetical protein